MRTTRSSSRVGTGLNLLFPLSRSVVLWQLGIVLTAVNAAGQPSMLSRPRDLLTADPRAFAEWVETAAPKPVRPEDKARSLRALPTEGEVTNLTDVVRRKLNAVDQFLRAAGRDSIYDIKVVDIPLARIALYDRSALLISEHALQLVDEKDLQALVAHELGHEYVAADYLRASQLGDHNRLKQLELICDAVAIVILHGRGLDPSRLMSSVERITRYNRKSRGTMVDERGYPTLDERQAFARAVTAWVTRQGDRRSLR